MERFLEYGVIGLFFAAFLAATILPLSSEFMLGILIVNGADPFLVVAVATAGNVLGSLSCYALGCWGSQALLQRWLKLADAELHRARERFNRYGSASLLLAWVPVVGDPLTVVAGLMRTPLWLFIALVSIGKFGRYLVVAAVV